MKSMKTLSDFESCAQRLKALAEPERLRIVQCLFAGPKNVGDLAAELKDEVVKVSHHLGILRNAGLVESTKLGRFVVYNLHPDVVAENLTLADPKQIDLGCCRLELPSEPVQISSRAS